MSYPSCVALIPARGGSRRIPRKNIRLLGGQPLVHWTIRAALDAQMFSRVIVSSDDEQILAACGSFDVLPMLRPQTSDDHEPDIVWVTDTLKRYHDCPSAFAILRPTSPFRQAETIWRAWAEFKRQEVHSLRAVQPVTEHPGKMWTWEGPGYPIKPLLDRFIVRGSSDDDINPIKHAVPWHSSPTQSLPTIYRQNASLEIAWSYVPLQLGSIAGTKVAPFFTNDIEGMDINTEDDWEEAERIATAIGVAHA